jgi:hypothetical protein
LQKTKVIDVFKHLNLQQKFKLIKLTNDKDKIKLIAMQVITSFIFKKIKKIKKIMYEKNMEELKKIRIQLRSRRIIINFLRNVCVNNIKSKLKIKKKLQEKYLNACIKIQSCFKKFLSMKNSLKLKLIYFHTQMFLITINNLNTNIDNNNNNNSSSYDKEKYNLHVSSVCSDNGRNHVELTNDQLTWLLVPSSLSLLSKKHQPKSILFQSSLHHIQYSEISHLISNNNNNNLALSPDHKVPSNMIQPIFQSEIIYFSNHSSILHYNNLTYFL